MKKILLAISAIMLSLALTACDDGMVSTPNNSSYYFGRNCESVVSELNKAGFTNIETTEVNDLTSDSPLQDGGIESVTIDGTSDFSSKDRFVPEISVKIVYHTIPKLKPPISSDEAQQLDYEEIEKQFKEAGFSDISYEELYDLDPDTAESDSKMEITVNGSGSFSTSTDFPFDSAIKVTKHYTYPKYDVKISVDFTPNLILSRYNVIFYADNIEQSTLTHGTDSEFALRLKEGEHSIKFVNVEDASVYGETVLNVTSDVTITYKISCHSDNIQIELIDLPVEDTAPAQTSTSVTEEDEEEPVYYSTNGKSTVKNGNSGVYAYKNRGENYNIYYIIDFDDGYVYSFMDGDVSSTCEKLKIDEGDLNDVVIITYHDGGEEWSNGLHFKWKNQPDHLILEDSFHNEYDYYCTDLSSALTIRNTKNIKEY